MPARHLEKHALNGSGGCAHGRSECPVGAMRVMFWGTLSMAVTSGIGALLGPAA